MESCPEVGREGDPREETQGEGFRGAPPLVLKAPGNQLNHGGGSKHQWGRGCVRGLVVAAGNNGEENEAIGQRLHTHSEGRGGSGRTLVSPRGGGGTL